VGFDPSLFSGFNINMKPNEAQCEENQGVKGEKIPPPLDFEWRKPQNFI
jgi:hypothetical protein